MQCVHDVHHAGADDNGRADYDGRAKHNDDDLRLYDVHHAGPYDDTRTDDSGTDNHHDAGAVRVPVSDVLRRQRWRMHLHHLRRRRPQPAPGV